MFDKIKNVKFYDEVNGKITKVGNATYSEFDVQKEAAKSASEYEKLPSIVRDLINLIVKCNLPIERVTYISKFRIYKKYRKMGIGTKKFKKFVGDMNPFFNAICIKSTPLSEDYPKEPDTITHINELIKQGFFLETNGFRDINSLCQFENGVAYIYMNNAAKPIIKEIISKEIKNEC